MFQRTKPLPRAILALLIASATASPGGTSSVVETAPAPWNSPIAFTLEARTVEHDAAFGLHVVRPVFHGPASALLVEAYGYEGEERLGLVGGGAIYRRNLGAHSSFEANAFFEGLRSTDGFSYPQFGAGAAFSPNRWLTLLANGYLPLRGKDSQRHGFERFTEREWNGATRQEVDFRRELRAERAPMRGFDVELELRLPEPPRWVDPRLAVGYAYREAEDRPEVYAGVTVRGELHFAKHWVAEAEWRNDAHGADQEWRVGVRFEMLLGAEEGSSDGRASERYLPAQRFPWPTVARGVEKGKAQRGDTRTLAPAPLPNGGTAASATNPDDCCPTGNPPLIFD